MWWEKVACWRLEHKSGNISDKAHRVVIFAIAQLSCFVTGRRFVYMFTKINDRRIPTEAAISGNWKKKRNLVNRHAHLTAAMSVTGITPQ